jgi:hypothetical protein
MTRALSVQYIDKGDITVHCRKFVEPEGLRYAQEIVIEIMVADSGCGIPSRKVESIVREFEQAETSEKRLSGAGIGEYTLYSAVVSAYTTVPVGLGLAVVARIVEQVGGQLRLASQVDEGSRFSFLIPLSLPADGGSGFSAYPKSGSSSSSVKESIGDLSPKKSRLNAGLDDSRDSALDDVVGRVREDRSRTATPPERSKEHATPISRALESAVPVNSQLVAPGTFGVAGLSQPTADATGSPSLRRGNSLSTNTSQTPSSTYLKPKTARTQFDASEQPKSASVGRSEALATPETKLRVLIVEVRVS